MYRPLTKANGHDDSSSIDVESYQKLKEWYLMLPCLTPSILRYGSRIRGANQ